MNYGPPDLSPHCACADSGPRAARAMLCQSGHLTECHAPLTCEEAACSHLRRYYEDEDTDPVELEARISRQEAQATTRLAALANPACSHCQRKGYTTVETTLGLGEIRIPGTYSPSYFTLMAVCTCITPTIKAG